MVLMGGFNAPYLANIAFENHLKIPYLTTWKITVYQTKGTGASWDCGSEPSVSWL